MFKGFYFFNIYNDCRQQSLFPCSNRMFSLDAEVKKLLKFGQYVYNSIIVTRLLVEISGCTLPILVVLLKMINIHEDYDFIF